VLKEFNKIELDKSSGQEYKLPCKNCDGETYHKVLYSVNKNYGNDDVSVWQDYEIIECQGCREISFRTNYVCSEDVFYHPETGEEIPIENIELYPNRIVGRKMIGDFYMLPEIVQKIYRETHGAICARLNILAGIGIRSLVEAMCFEKFAVGSNLEQKIDDLMRKGVITKDSSETLHQTRLLGNASAHQITPPTDEELEIAMDIVENLLKTIYVISKKAQKLPKRTL